MQSNSAVDNKRRQGRRKAVLPVKVRGRDAAGNSFEELAHTLDVTPTGVRLGAIRHDMAKAEHLTVSYRQRRMEFRVVWTKKLEATGEYQVGLEAVAQEGEAWGFSPADFQERVAPSSNQAAISRASGI